MKGFILGFIIGVMWSNVGFSGMARILDRSLSGLQEYSKEAAK